MAPHFVENLMQPWKHGSQEICGEESTPTKRNVMKQSCQELISEENQGIFIVKPEKKKQIDT